MFHISRVLTVWKFGSSYGFCSYSLLRINIVLHDFFSLELILIRKMVSSLCRITIWIAWFKSEITDRKHFCLPNELVLTFYVMHATYFITAFKLVRFFCYKKVSNCQSMAQKKPIFLWMDNKLSINIFLRPEFWVDFVNTLPC